MQPFHIKQIWVKKEDDPGKNSEKKESKRDSSSSSDTEQVQVVPLPNWEDMFPKKLEMMRHVEQRKKKEDLSPNPYRYNLSGSNLKIPSSLSSPNKKAQHEEIGEKIASLEKISKACVETISEGVDSYWMMSKDLENKVNDVNSKVDILAKIVCEMGDDRKLLLKIIENQQADIVELSTRFKCIAHACNLKRKDEEDDVFLTPKGE